MEFIRELFEKATDQLTSLSSLSSDDINYWRERFLLIVLIMGLLAGTVVFIPSIYFLISKGDLFLALVDSLAYAMLLVIVFFKKIRFQQKVWLISLAIYALGTFIYYRLGPYSGGPVWLFTFPIIAGVLLGNRAAWLALALNAATFTVLGILLINGLVTWGAELREDVLRWVVYTFNTLFVNALATVAVTYLIKKISEGFKSKADAEAALILGEARLRQIIDLIPHFIFAKDRNGNYILVNKAVADALGTTVEALEGHAAPDFYHTQQRADDYRTGDLKVIEAGIPLYIPEASIIDSKGDVHYLESYKLPFIISDTNDFAVLTVSLDITTRKLAEEELRESWQSYADLVRAIPSGLFIYKYLPPDRLILLSGNPESEKLTGISEVEFKGCEFDEIWPEAKQAGITDKFLEVMRTGQTYEVEDVHYQDIRLKGAFRIRAFALPGMRLAVAFENVTERRLAKEELEKSEARYRSLAENSTDYIMRYDRQGRHVYVNPACCRVAGISAQEFEGRTHRELGFPPDLCEVWEKLLKKVFTTGEHLQKTFEWESAKGPLVLDWRLSPEFDQHGEVASVLGISRDITELVRAQAERNQLESQLLHSQKMEALGTLSGGIAHDFNNILGAILGYAEIVRDDSMSGRVDTGDVEQIITAAEKAKNLVRQILTFSRRVEPVRKPLDLNQEVERALELLRHTLPKMITAQLHLSPRLSFVSADSNQLNQIILNLASNASQAMPDGGQLTISTENIRIGEKPCPSCGETFCGEWVSLTISDTGEGIDPKYLPKIFDPFFTTKEVGRGTGLGLATVHGIVHNHGGHIECISRLGHGTSFRVYLPMADEIAQAGGKVPTVEVGNLPGGSEKILLVDDEESLRKLGTRTLQGQGYNVTTAGSGEEAVEIYSQRGDQVDLVIMDLGMPGMGGYKAIKAIREIDPNAKIIVASGYSATGRAKRAMEDGAVGYVGKPFRKAQLLGTVRSVLDGESINSFDVLDRKMLVQ